jgi:glutamyl-tRNA synthetase
LLQNRCSSVTAAPHCSQTTDATLRDHPANPPRPTGRRLDRLGAAPVVGAPAGDAQTDRVAGRFAPSPTGDLHLGNLRTAAIAWLSARTSGAAFLVRMEDLDRSQASAENERRQLADLARIGVDWHGEVVRQSERFDRYEAAIDRLDADGLVYECYCTRREIRAEIDAAPAAPHLPPGGYPGLCRDLTAAERRARRRAGRPPALRLRTEGESIELVDLVHGRVRGVVDDVVLRRNDGVPAYNLAVVVDDAAQGVTEVVRGDDLLSSTPRQIHLQHLLGLPGPRYAHVPLVLGEDGERLAKRHGAVTLDGVRAIGRGPEWVVSWIARSLGLAGPHEPVTLDDLLDRFRWDDLPREVVVAPAETRVPAVRNGR